MQKTIGTILSLVATIIILSVALSSCKDEEPAKPPSLSLAVATMDVKESDGTIEIELKLDKPAKKDIVVEYSLDGTALDVEAAGENADPDYEIVSEYGEVQIAKGQTSGIIEIELLSDLTLENAETIEIKLESVDEGIELTRDDEITINVKQEDGMVVALYWPNPTTTASADMDMLVRVGASAGNWEGVLTGSLQDVTRGPEFVFLPKTFGDAAFGLSYTYYEGTIDPLNFTVRFIDVVDTQLEPEASQQIFTATYTAANKNKWTDINSMQVVQTFVKSGGSFTNISAITVPASGSRVVTEKELKSKLKKGDRNLSIKGL